MKIQQYHLYSGSSIVGLVPSARVVILNEHENIDLNTFKEKIEKVFNDAVGYDSKYELVPNFVDINSIEEIFLKIIIFIQKIKRHIVQNIHGITPLKNNRYEIYFDISKVNGMKEIIFCALSLINDVLEKETTNNFKNNYKSLPAYTKFGLRDLFIFDKMQNARHLLIPTYQDSGSRIFIGDGKYTTLIASGYLSNTSVLGKNIAGDKDRSSMYFNMQNLPAPQQETARSTADCVKAAQKIGFPVVVKPRSGNKGRAVSVNLNNDEEVAKAYNFSEEEMGSSSVVIEKFIEGNDHRILVVNYQVIAVVKRIPAYIIGDGIQTIEQLIDATNILQRRDGLKLFAIKLDQEVKRFIELEALLLTSVPKKNRYIQLRGAANQSLGGTTVDLTDVIHPDNISMAIEAARTSMLNVAGVDFVTTDISKSFKEGFGGIVEINAGPGVDLHMYPTDGLARNVSWAMSRAEFKQNEISAIPKVLLLGKKYRKSTSKLVSNYLSYIGYYTGLYTNDKIYIGAEEKTNTDSTLQDMLVNKNIDCAIIETSSEKLLTKGTVLQNTNVTIITEDIFSNNLKEKSFCDNIENRIIRLSIELTSELVILDGNSDYAASTLEYIPNLQVVLVFNKIDNNKIFNKHIKKGAWCLFIESKNKYYNIVHQKGNKKTILKRLDKKEYKQKNNPILEQLFSIATLIHFESSLIRVKKLLKLTNKSINTKSTIVFKIYKDINFIVANSIDKVAYNNIKSIKTQDKKTYILCDSNSDMTLYQEMKANENNFFILGKPEMLFDKWKFIIDCANKKDTVIYLSSNRVSRKMFINYVQNKPLKYNSNKDFKTINSTYINKIFQSNLNHRRNFEINHISINHHTVGKNDLVVILENYDVEKNHITEKLIIEAIEDGAKAVVCSFYPSRLARYYNILISENISLGLQMIALDRVDNITDKNKLIRLNNEQLVSFINKEAF